MAAEIPPVVILRSADRHSSGGDGIVSRYCFSFGAHYDPGNTSFGALVACNEEALEPGAGFAAHPHAGIEILTWVVQGTLEHSDSAGRVVTCPAGTLQLFSTGSGIEHAEVNYGDDACTFVQLWLALDKPGPTGAYEQVDLRDSLPTGVLATAISLPAGPVLYVGWLRPDAQVTVPAAPLAHVFVVRGSLSFGGGAGMVGEGDSARLTCAGEVPATAGQAGAEVLVLALPHS